MKGKILLLTIVSLLASINKLLLAQNIPPVIEWQHAYGGTEGEEFRGLELTSDGGFISIGISQSPDGDVIANLGNSDYWIVRGDSIGNILWQKVYGGSKADWGRSITKTNDGGYIACGYSQSNDNYVAGNHGDYDMWVIKLDSLGNLVWQKSYGGSGFDNAYRAIQTSDGNFLVVGFTESNDGQVTNFHGGQDYWILKLDPLGNIIWTKTMGGTGKEQASCVVESGTNYYIAGYADSNDGDISDHKGKKDLWVVKLTQSGNVTWKKSYGGTVDDGARWIIPGSDGGFVISGFSASSNGDCTFNHGSYDFWVIKINSAGTLIWQKSLGGSDYEYSYHLSADLDGNYLVDGYTFSSDGDVTGQHGIGSADYWLVKIDKQGNLLWQKTFGGSLGDECRSALAKTNGHYLLAGFSASIDGDVTFNHGGSDAWLIDACPTPQTFYRDTDNDGYGAPATSLVACYAPANYVSNNLDCNDNNASQHPGATEFCNGIDDDCSGVVDNNISAPTITASGATTFCSGENVLLIATNFSNVDAYQWYQNNVAIANATSTTYAASSGGNYSFTASYQSCAAASNTIVVTVNSTPTATITNGSTVNSCKGDHVTLSATACGGCLYQWKKNGTAVSGATSSSYMYTSNSSAGFTITVTSSAGCSATSSATQVNKLNKPVATIIALGDLNICNTGSVTLQASSGAGYTYKWNKNGTNINGATNQNYTATSPADYTVKVTDANGCKKTSAAVTVYSSCKLSDESSALKISISPNPSNGNFILTIFSQQVASTIITTLLDLVGKEVMKKSFPITDYETATSFALPASLPNGIYFLKVKTNEQVQVVRIVVEK